MSGIWKSTWQSCMLSVTSNVLAQSITAFREQKPLSIDYLPILHFIGYTILNVPINCVWQDWLEATFPGQKAKPPPPGPAPADTKKALKEKEGRDVGAKVKDLAEAKGKTMDWRNTAIKFALDQTVGAVFNTVLFIAGIGMFQGRSKDQIVTSIKEDTFTIIAAGAKLWPAVSALSFTVIPPERRVVFGSLVGVVWGVFLSLMAAK